jgi:hypothetical protein
MNEVKQTDQLPICWTNFITFTTTALTFLECVFDQLFTRFQLKYEKIYTAAVEVSAESNRNSYATC